MLRDAHATMFDEPPLPMIIRDIPSTIKMTDTELISQPSVETITAAHCNNNCKICTTVVVGKVNVGVDEGIALSKGVNRTQFQR